MRVNVAIMRIFHGLAAVRKKTNNPEVCGVFDRVWRGVRAIAQNPSQNRRQALQSTSVDIFKSK